MLRLIRGFLTAALVVLFAGLVSAALASDASPSPQRHHRRHHLRPGAIVPFTATAYCRQGVTQSGIDTRSGIAAADPVELPVGSVVRIDANVPDHDGIYTVLDTGAKVVGHKVDLFMRDCREAQRFGKQPVRVTVLRKGWSPKASAPPAQETRGEGPGT